MTVTAALVIYVILMICNFLVPIPTTRRVLAMQRHHESLQKHMSTMDAEAKASYVLQYMPTMKRFYDDFEELRETEKANAIVSTMIGIGLTVALVIVVILIFAFK